MNKIPTDDIIIIKFPVIQHEQEAGCASCMRKTLTIIIITVVVLFCGSFNGGFSVSKYWDYIASDDKMINDKLKWMWKEMVVA
jgi:hypothetical protein